MTCFFKVFGPGQHVFKNNNFKMIDFGQRGNNLFLVALVFLTFFFLLLRVAFRITQF